MSSYQLTEIVVQAVIAQIRTFIAPALSDVAAARGDGMVNMLRPQEYFYFETNKNYRKPAVFVIAEGLDTMLPTGPNFMNAGHDINVAVVLEDSRERELTLACWRYQCALMRVLHLTQLSGPGLQSKMILKVQGAKYSPVYTEDSKPGAAAVFCKEVMLNLRVEEYEPLS